MEILPLVAFPLGPFTSMGKCCVFSVEDFTLSLGDLVCVTKIEAVLAIRAWFKGS